MRTNRFLAAITGCLLACLTASAQSPYPAVRVVLQDVEVRSGPSNTFFPTSKLRRGDKVLVVRESKEAPGWLEIEPPTGSFSWISGKHVKLVKDDPRHAVVEPEPGRPALVMPGSTLVNQAPNRKILEHTAGTIVVVVDRPLNANGETWYPVRVHPSEVRYLPADAVQPATQVATNSGSPNWTLASGGYYGNPLLAEADKALEKGDRLQAQQLLQKVADSATDPNQKQLALNKLKMIEHGTFQPASVQKPGEPVTSFSPGPLSNVITVKAAEWSTYGRLRETGLKRQDGQPVYALEPTSGTGAPLAYVTTAPGKSLQAQVGRIVTVYGPTVYRPEASALQYIVASHFASP